MVDPKIIFHPPHPGPDIGKLRQDQTGLMGEAGIGHQRDVGQ